MGPSATMYELGIQHMARDQRSDEQEPGGKLELESWGRMYLNSRAHIGHLGQGKDAGGWEVPPGFADTAETLGRSTAELVSMSL